MCYTDKFPYCLPACLNGYKLDTATNTCQPNTPACGGPKMTVNFTRNDNAPNAITLGSSTVLTNNPSFYLSSNGTAITDNALLYDTPNLAVRRHDGYVEFLARNSLAQYGYYTGTITLENATVSRVEGGLTTYNYTDIGLEPIEADSATKTSDTVVSFQIAFALQGDSFRIYYTPTSGGTCSGGTTTPPATTNEQWIAYTTPYYIYLSKLPITANTVAGKTFYIYNPEKVITRASMTKATFLADPITAIKNAPNITVGSTGVMTSRDIFNLAQLQSEDAAIQTSTINNLTTSIAYRYLCAENQVNSTQCSYNNHQVHKPGTGYVL